jgi:hypothetical protein
MLNPSSPVPNWGHLKPRKIHMANGIWNWMRTHPSTVISPFDCETLHGDGWIVYDEIFHWQVKRWKNGFTSNELANLLSRQKKAFEKSENTVYVTGNVNTKFVHMWRAI